MSRSASTSREALAQNAIQHSFSRLRRASISSVLWLAPLILGLMIGSANPPVLESLRNLVFDQYQRFAPREWSPDLPVRVIDIDDASLKAIGQWPWPRKRVAELAAKLHALGAAAIVFDILFAEEDRLTAEAMLAQLPDIPERTALGKALADKGLIEADPLTETLAKTPSVLAFVLTNEGASHGLPLKTGFASVGDDPIPFLVRFHSAIPPLPSLAEKAAGLGSINWVPDHDLIVRKAPLLFSLETREGPILVPSLGAEALRVAQAASTIIVKSSNASGAQAYGASTGIISVKIGDAQIATESDGMVRVRFAGTRDGRHISAWRVLQDELGDDDVRDKILLIGSSAAALADLRSTPLEAAVPGVDIHAELLEHIVTGARLARPDYAPGLEALLLLLGGIASALLARFANPIAAAVLTLAVIAGFIAASFIAFLRADLLFDPIMPAATSLTAYTTMTIAVYRRSERQRRFVRQAFGRYLAPALVERLAKDPSRLRLGGEARDVTVLFSDIRGFTARAETLSASEVVGFLNSLHTPLTEIVLSEQGTLDKYIGDGLMAFWNAPAEIPNHAEHACRAALAMCRAVAQIDAKVAAETALTGGQHRQIDIGVGVSTGEVFVGNIGSEHRFDYSIIGDTVNVAARLEQATKELGISMLAAEATVRAAPNFLFLPLGKIELKGKSLPLNVYSLHGPVSPEGDAEFEAFLELHMIVLDALDRRDSNVGEAIAAAKAHAQSAGYTKFYDRCLLLARDSA
jgi:adenylate cyclase